MLDFVSLDIAKFSDSYAELKAKHTWDKNKLRRDLAQANNCIAIGEDSCYADMVAVPKDNPNLVIKICPTTDKFVHYARACFTGELSGPSMLNVYSETKISDDAVLFMMERLDRKLTDHEWEMTVKRAKALYVELPKRGKYATACRNLRIGMEKIKEAMNNASQKHHFWWNFDIHRGNLMCRKDGTIVYLDPVN